MPGGTLKNACSLRRLVNLPKLILGGSCSNPHVLASNRRGSSLSLLSFQVLLILNPGPLYCTCILVEADSNWREVWEADPRFAELLQSTDTEVYPIIPRWSSEHYLYVPVVPFLEGLRAKQNPLVRALFPIASWIQISYRVQTCSSQGTRQLCIIMAARLASNKTQYLSWVNNVLQLNE